MNPKNRGFFILAGLTIAAVGFAVYDFRSEKSANESKLEKSRLVAWQPDQVNQVEISGSTASATTKDSTAVISNKIKLVKTVDGWKIEEPIQEMADPAVIEEFVGGIVSESSDEVLQENQQIDWKVFGLDEPRGSISVQNNLGEKMTIFISAKKNYQGDAFLRRNQEQKVLLASSTWFSKLDKKVMDFREKRLLRKSLATAEGLDFQAGGEKFSLVYKDQKWTAPAHADWNLDQNKIREFLANLSNPLIHDYTKESAATPEERKKWGLSPSRAEMKVKFKDGSVWTGTLGRDAGAVDRVEISEPPVVVVIPAADAAKFAEFRLDSLRDRHEPFAFKKVDVKKIEFESSEGVSSFELKGELWEPVKKIRNDDKIGSERVAGFLARLGALEVGEFADKKTLPDRMGDVVRLRDDKDQIVFELRIGEKQKRKLLGRDRPLVQAKTNLYPDLFWLDDSTVRQLEVDEFFGRAKRPVEGEKR